MCMLYRTRSKFHGLNFRVAPSNCIRGSLYVRGVLIFVVRAGADLPGI